MISYIIFVVSLEHTVASLNTSEAKVKVGILQNTQPALEQLYLHVNIFLPNRHQNDVLLIVEIEC